MLRFSELSTLVFVIYIYDVSLTIGSVIAYYASNSVYVYLVVQGVRAINSYFAPAFFLLYVGRLLYHMIEKDILIKEKADEKKRLVMRRVLPLMLPGAFFTFPIGILLITKTHVSYVQPSALIVVTLITLMSSVQSLLALKSQRSRPTSTKSEGPASTRDEASSKPTSTSSSSKKTISKDVHEEDAEVIRDDGSQDDAEKKSEVEFVETPSGSTNSSHSS